MGSYYSVLEGRETFLGKLKRLLSKHRWEEKESSASYPAPDMERREYGCSKCQGRKVVYRIF